MTDNKVTCIPQKGYYLAQIAINIGEYFDKNGYDFNDKTIALKPSFVMPTSDIKLTLATNTHITLVAGVAKALSLRGASKIYIIEHRTIGPARYAFYTSNIKKAVKGIKNVKLCYLDEVKTVKKTLAILKELMVPIIGVVENMKMTTSSLVKEQISRLGYLFLVK